VLDFELQRGVKADVAFADMLGQGIMGCLEVIAQGPLRVQLWLVCDRRALLLAPHPASMLQKPLNR